MLWKEEIANIPNLGSWALIYELEILTKEFMELFVFESMVTEPQNKTNKKKILTKDLQLVEFQYCFTEILKLFVCQSVQSTFYLKERTLLIAFCCIILIFFVVLLFWKHSFLEQQNNNKIK